jgi:hypothetical protein
MEYHILKNSTNEPVSSASNFTIDRNVSEEAHKISLKREKININFTLSNPCIQTNFTLDDLSTGTLSGINIQNFNAKFGYGLNFSNTFSNGMLAFNYSGLSMNENRIRVYKCHDWDVAASTCSGSWVKVSYSVDNTNKLVYVPVTSFSGFAVGESPYYTVNVAGVALNYFTGRRVNGNITLIPLEDPESKNTTAVVNGEWSMSLDMTAENVENLMFVVEGGEEKGYNQMKLPTPSSVKLNCTTQNISLSGYSVDVDSGSSITSGNVRASVLDTDYTYTTSFTGTWSVDLHPCLVSGQIYTLQILVSDNTGKRGEILQKYPAK